MSEQVTRDTLRIEKVPRKEAVTEPEGTVDPEAASGAETAAGAPAEQTAPAEAEEQTEEPETAAEESAEDAEDAAEDAEGLEETAEDAEPAEPYRDTGDYTDSFDDTGDDAGDDAGEETEEDDGGRTFVGANRKRRKHRKKHWVRRILIAAGLVAVFIFVGTLPYFQITEIAVIGNRTVSDKNIRKHSKIRKGDSILFVNPIRAKLNIKKNRFIEKVNIDRHLPGSVEIIVTEREAAMQFVRYTKKGTPYYVLTDKEGMVLKTAKNQQDVTMINNIHVTGSVVGEKIKVKETGTYRMARDLIDITEKGDLYFKRINIRGSMVQVHIFDHLSCRGRYDNLVKSIENGELKSVVYKLYQEGNEMGMINIGDNNYCSFTPQN